MDRRWAVALAASVSLAPLAIGSAVVLNPPTGPRPVIAPAMFLPTAPAPIVPPPTVTVAGASVPARRVMKSMQANYDYLRQHLSAAPDYQANWGNISTAASSLALLVQQARDDKRPAGRAKLAQEDWEEEVDAFYDQMAAFNAALTQSPADPLPLQGPLQSVTGACVRCHDRFGVKVDVVMGKKAGQSAGVDEKEPDDEP